MVEIKIPLHLPYYSSGYDYEAFEGEITIQGNHLNYVKRKVSQDTLFLLCLPNTEKDKLQLAEIKYGEKANDFEGDSKNANSIKKQDSFSQYHLFHNDYSLTPSHIIINKETAFVSFFVPDSFVSRDDIPPELHS